jgi:hypothetical protein
LRTSALCNRRARNWIAFALFVAITTPGCDDNSGVGKTYPVSGKVTLDGQILVAQETMVLFLPDASKGNQSSFEPAGTIDGDGNYSLSTKGKKGAPPGWYRIVVTALADSPQHPKGGQHSRPVGHSLAPSKYGSGRTTDLVIEVVENPGAGAYDLKLTTK